MSKFDRLVIGVCTLVEMVGIVGLTAIGLKRNNDCYKAEVKLAETELELMTSQMDNVLKDAQICELTKEVDYLKTKYENTEGEA